MLFARLLRYLKCSVDEELIHRNALLEAQIRELLRQSKKPLRFTDTFRIEAATLAKKLSQNSLEEVALVVRPSTLLRWYRKLISKKFDGSQSRMYPGRPRIKPETERLIIEMAINTGWGAERIKGALAHLGIDLCHQTVLNVLKRNGLHPAPRRLKDVSWASFLAMHRDVTVATDFFTSEVFTARGLLTYYVLFFIDLGTRVVHVAGITANPTEQWMVQVARNLTMTGELFFEGKKYLIHDRDSKYCKKFRKIFENHGIKLIRLPPYSPNLNAFAERWVGSIKSECLDRLILFGKGSLERAVQQYVTHYNRERPHQGKNNKFLIGDSLSDQSNSPIKVTRRIGSLLSYYYRQGKTQPDSSRKSQRNLVH
jgi:transposase InsO family protein